MRALATLATAALVGAFAAPAAADAIEWLPSLEQGLGTAKKSGRAVLYVTLWKPGT